MPNSQAWACQKMGKVLKESALTKQLVTNIVTSMNSLPAQPNQSLMEGIEVLFALVQRGRPAGVRKLARELGMTPTRLQRYVATLAHLGLAAQGTDRRYGPGPGVHVLSAMSLSASGLAARALQVLPELNDLGVIVALGMLWRRSVSYVYFSEPGAPMAHSLGKESGWPARESVIGMLLLSRAPLAVLERDFAEEAEELAPLLAETKKRGYARREDERGRISLAVPVGVPPIAGLAVSGLRCVREEKPMLQRLNRVAAKLSDPNPGDKNENTK